MKKIFFCVLMFTIVLRVEAALDVYSSWSSDYPSGIPKDVIQSEDRYKWYKEDIVDVEYLKKEDIYNKLVDYDDYKTYESEELLDEPLKINDRIILKEYKDYKFTSDNVNYIVIENNNKNGTLGIFKLMIIDQGKGKELKISLDDKYSNIVDEDTTNSYVMEYNEKIYINLNEECKASNLRVFIYYHSSSYENKMTITYNAHKDYPIYETVRDLFLATYAELCNAGLGAMKETSRTYKLNVYKYIDKYYKTYRINKTYEDEYYAFLEGYKKDESTKKTFYRYLKYKKVYYGSSGRSETPENCFGKDSCIITLEEIKYPDVPDEVIPTIEEVPKTIDTFSITGLLISFMFFISTIIYLIKNKCKNLSYD